MSRLDKFNALLLALIFAAMPCWAQFTIPFATGAAKSAPTSNTFTRVQFVNTSNTCTACTTFSLTVPSTGSGHLLVLVAAAYNGTAGGISSTTVPTGGGTWVVPAGCATSNSGTFSNVSCAYVLSSTSGATAVSITMSASNNYTFWYYEYSFTQGSTSLDGTPASVSDTTAATTQPGAVLPITGSSDLIIHIAASNSGLSSVAAPYTLDASGTGNGGGQGAASDANTSSGAADSYTLAASGELIDGALAFK